MRKLTLKPDTIEFAEDERLKSLANDGPIVHANNFSNVSYPAIVYDYEKKEFNEEVHRGITDRVVESFVASDGRSWYRKWASGWKECGIHKNLGNLDTQNSSRTKITYPIEGFINPHITMALSPGGNLGTYVIGRILAVTSESVDVGLRNFAEGSEKADNISVYLNIQGY